jgi:thiamine pyrophosphokinase
MGYLIVANGVEDEVAWLRPWLVSADCVIAADGGSNLLRRLDWLPDLVIGDGDSADSATQAWLRQNGVPWQRVPAEKDQTDLELALRHALAASDDPIRIAGAFGGRVDHWLANILLLADPALAGRDVALISADTRLWLVRDTLEIDGAPGDIVSLLPLAGPARVAHTSGLAWPLQQSVLAFGSPRGVSNHLTAPVARITLAEGMVVCIHLPGGAGDEERRCSGQRRS